MAYTDCVRQRRGHCLGESAENEPSSLILVFLSLCTAYCLSDSRSVCLPTEYIKTLLETAIVFISWEPALLLAEDGGQQGGYWPPSTSLSLQSHT